MYILPLGGALGIPMGRDAALGRVNIYTAGRPSSFALGCTG